jgi:acetate kinase
LGNGPLTVSSGTTPLEGLPGETSCGEMDPGIILDLCRINGWGPEQINTVLTRQSGLLGLAGRRVTLAEVLASEGENLRLARDVERYRILLAVGAGLGALGGLDAIVFSGRYVEAAQSLAPWLIERIAKTGPKAAWSCLSASLETLVAAQAGQVIEPADLPRPAVRARPHSADAT